MTPDHRRRLAYLLILATPALWSVNYLVARTAPGVIGPHMLALCRWALAGLLLAALAWPEIRANRAALAREWWQMAILGALGMWICGAFVYIGGKTTSATNISLIYALSPVLIALFSSAVLVERLVF